MYLILSMLQVLNLNEAIIEITFHSYFFATLQIVLNVTYFIKKFPQKRI